MASSSSSISGLVEAHKKRVVVIVTPLVALMVDQVQSLRAKGVNGVII